MKILILSVMFLSLQISYSWAQDFKNRVDMYKESGFGSILLNEGAVNERQARNLRNYKLLQSTGSNEYVVKRQRNYCYIINHYSPSYEDFDKSFIYVRVEKIINQKWKDDINFSRKGDWVSRDGKPLEPHSVGGRKLSKFNELHNIICKNKDHELCVQEGYSKVEKAFGPIHGYINGVQMHSFDNYEEFIVDDYPAGSEIFVDHILRTFKVTDSTASSRHPVFCHRADNVKYFTIITYSPISTDFRNEIRVKIQ